MELTSVHWQGPTELHGMSASPHTYPVIYPSGNTPLSQTVAHISLIRALKGKRTTTNNRISAIGSFPNLWEFSNQTFKYFIKGMYCYLRQFKYDSGVQSFTVRVEINSQAKQLYITVEFFNVVRSACSLVTSILKG